MAKKRPQLGAVSDYFRLWSGIFPERIDEISNVSIIEISKIGKASDQLQPLPR